MDNTEHANETTQLDEVSQALFPEGLMAWAGHREGGVRQPFHKESGRPSGEQIVTPLVKRLSNWAKSVASGEDVPRAILLVGGPGNGKTDAVEGCVEALDHALGADGALYEKFAQSYRVVAGEVPPREVRVDLADLQSAKKLEKYSAITLVQDATENDPSRGATSEELLMEDFNRLCVAKSDELYLCCVNRGILANVASLAIEKEEEFKLRELVSSITAAVTSGAAQPHCWPLEEHAHIAVWPMDVESLLVSSESDSVAHQIFAIALDEEKWKQPCELKTRCPFCQNQKLLSRKGTLDNLIQLLHYYELSTGKRWTFRDLFSLIPYLLVGDQAELEIQQKKYTPCDWAKKQHEIINKGKDQSLEKDRAPYLLMSKLYFHRLFPVWPSFDRGQHRTSKEILDDIKIKDEGFQQAKAFFRFTRWLASSRSAASGYIPDRVRHSVCPVLDPALSTGNETIFEQDKDDVTVSMLEDRFSQSVQAGLDLVKHRIEPLERDVLERLARADDSLVEDIVQRTRSHDAAILRSTIRQYAARLVKRSIGSRVGVCKDSAVYREYYGILHNPDSVRSVRKEMKSLLLDSDKRFRAALATTFGQPVAERSRDVTLLTRPVRVQVVDRVPADSRPVNSLPYFKIETHPVALTFDLFKALQQIKAGLHEASLPPEIFSLLDRVKSMVSGEVVRDEEVLSDDPEIMLGDYGDKIEYSNGDFEYVGGK